MSVARIDWTWESSTRRWSALVDGLRLIVEEVTMGRRSWWEGRVAGLKPSPLKVPGPQYRSPDAAKSAALRLVARHRGRGVS